MTTTFNFEAYSEKLRNMRAAGKAPVTYDINISEPHRLALLELIRNAPATVNGSDAPLAYWIEMLTSLPEDESNTPGCTHGFCL